MISQLLFRSRVWSIVSKISIKSINQILFFLIWVHQVVYILACYNQWSKAKNINKQYVVNFKSQRSPIISNSKFFFPLAKNKWPGANNGDRIKQLKLLRHPPPPQRCSCNVLIEKLKKFTIHVTERSQSWSRDVRLRRGLLYRC